jgi:hypothetical protein
LATWSGKQIKIDGNRFPYARARAPEAPPDPGAANPGSEELVEEGGGLVRSRRELLQPPAAQQGERGRERVGRRVWRKQRKQGGTGKLERISHASCTAAGAFS